MSAAIARPMLVPSPAPQTKLDWALWAAHRGIRVFPVRPDSKEPVVRDWPNKASRDEAQIRRWWQSQPDRNIGWAMGDSLPSGRFLVALDVDAKPGGANGEASLQALLAELGLAGMPATLTQTTPSGYRGPDKQSEGGHLVLSSLRPLANSAGALGPGLDIRGRAGYVLGCGSTIKGVPYKVVDLNSRILPMPEAIEARLSAHTERPPASSAAVDGVDSNRARDRARDYVRKAAPAIQGNGGDQRTYKVACDVKDLGCTESETAELMLPWNERCIPPWNDDELREKIAHAYRYGTEPVGAVAPEAVFTEAPAADADKDEASPLEKLNAEYAFLQDGHILRETVDSKGRFALRHMSPAAFNLWFKNKPFQVGKRTVPLSEAWLEWSGRRQYEGLVFDPRGTQDPRFYNLWHGFAVEPADSPDHPMVARFLEHSLQNVCGGDRSLHRWLIGFFAHLIQRPWEKPLVCIVFRGRKGTGKNALIERIMHLLGCHGFLVTDRRYLVSNFNTHLENCLLLTLDEAFWSGDKEGEGKLKGLITGAQHVIEPKNLTPYQVDNLTRVALLGNEKWLVPATSEERRFAVFEVGDGRIQDRRYFEELRVGLDERGGDAHLLRYLLDYDLTGIDLNKAPNTRGLAEQKDETLTGVDRFWRECVDVASVGDAAWSHKGARVTKKMAFSAYEDLRKSNRYKYPHRSEKSFWGDTYKLFPEMNNPNLRLYTSRAVDLPYLEDARRRIVERLGILPEWTHEPARIDEDAPQPTTAGQLFAENDAISTSIFD